MENPFSAIDKRLNTIESFLLEIRQQLRDQPDPASSATDGTPLTVKQAADFLSISPQTIYQRINKIPHKKRFGRLYFYPSELRVYIAGGEGADDE